MRGVKFYSKTHEWMEEDAATKEVKVGITDHAQHALGDVVYVGLPRVGATFKASEVFADVESVKATSDIYSPVGGVVAAVNEAVTKTPALLNSAAESDGWLVKFKDVSGKASDLMDSAAYKKFVEETSH